jgi:effector-binding domain-containing protein
VPLAASGQEADEKDEVTPAKVHLKRTEPRTMATLKHQGPFSDIPQMMSNLTSEIDEGDRYAAGPPMVAYFNSPDQVPENELIWQVMIPVVNPGQFRQIEMDKLGFSYMNAALVAYAYHIGSYETVGETYGLLFAWASRNDYEIAGPPMEIYWSDPEDTPEERLVTELWLPVKEKKSESGVKH